MDKNIKIIFMGTPDFGVEALRRIVSEGYNVVGVFTQMDKPRNRLKVESCAIKLEALNLGLPVFSFARLRDRDGIAAIKALSPDLIITAAFGQILSQELLDIPTIGTFNIHASLLPKYRGGCPIQWAIINGESTTGVTIMRTVLKLDAGDIIFNVAIPIEPVDNYRTLYNKLSVAGANAILHVLQSDNIVYTMQNEQDATYFPVITKEMGGIDWSKAAEEIDCLIRGVTPLPCAYTHLYDKVLKIYKASIDYNDYDGKAGEVVVSDAAKGLIVKCGKQAIRLEQVQLPSKNKLSIIDFLRGNSVPVGTILSQATNNECG